VAISPERWIHGSVELEVGIAPREAIARATRPPGVRGLSRRQDSRRPRFRFGRGVVYPPPAPDTIMIDNPIIVVEMLSPTTAALDHGVELQGYFSLASLARYLILDPGRRVAIHHGPGERNQIVTRFVGEGEPTLAPPGIEVRAEDLLGPRDEPKRSPEDL